VIRKATIVVLTTLAVTAFGLGVAANYQGTVSWAKHDADGLPWVWLLCTADKLSIQHWSAIGEKRPRSWTKHESVGVGILIHIGDVSPPGYTQPDRLPVKIISLFCPRWFPFLLCLLLAAYPTIVLIRGPLRRWRRRRKGLCLRCGYNLTGLPEPRCPECGESI
jgi:hypothetical protein